MVIGIANLHPLIAIVAGVLILIQPKLLNAVVAIYLILTGILELGLLRLFIPPGVLRGHAARRRWRMGDLLQTICRKATPVTL